MDSSNVDITFGPFCFELIFEKMLNVQIAHKKMFGRKHFWVFVIKRKPFATPGSISSNTQIDSTKINY